MNAMTTPSHVVHVDHSADDAADLPMYTAARWATLHAELVAWAVNQQRETGGSLTVTGTVWEGSLRLSDLHGCTLAHHSWIADNRSDTDAFAAGYLAGGDHRGEGDWTAGDGWLVCPRPHGRVQPDAACDWCAGWSAAWE